MPENYNVDFWFDNKLVDPTGIMDGFGPGYYGYKILEQLICKIDIPSSGKIVLWGARDHSIGLLCKLFTADRVIGYDVGNPNNNPNIKIQNILELTNHEPIAFSYNDVGSFKHTPVCKLHAHMLAVKHTMKGGYLLGRNNINVAKINLEGICVNHDFENFDLSLVQEYQGVDVSDHTIFCNHLLSRKK